MTTTAQLRSTSPLTFDSISNIKEPTRRKFRNPETGSIHTVQVFPESGAYYVHIKTPENQELRRETTKTYKFAERHLMQIQNTDFRPPKKQKTSLSPELVVRVVAKRNPKENCNKRQAALFLKLLADLKDIPGIVKHYDYVKTVNKRKENQFVYYQEKYAGNLVDFLDNPVPLSKAQLKKITETLLSTLNALHQKRIYHRNLKIENVLIDLSKEIPVALCDFEAAFQHGMSETRRNQLHGTWITYSPETMHAHLHSRILRFEEKDLAANDVWGMGMILYALHKSQKLPFDLNESLPETNQKCMIGLLRQEDIDVRPKQGRKDGQIDPIIYRMLQTDPAKRISAEEALNQFRELHNPSL